MVFSLLDAGAFGLINHNYASGLAVDWQKVASFDSTKREHWMMLVLEQTNQLLDLCSMAVRLL